MRFSFLERTIYWTVEPRPLPPLDPGPSLPRPYMNFGASKTEASSLLHDLEAEGVQQSAPSQPLAPRPSLELNKDGKPMTKRQKKEEVCLCILSHTQSLF